MFRETTKRVANSDSTDIVTRTQYPIYTLARHPVLSYLITSAMWTHVLSAIESFWLWEHNLPSSLLPPCRQISYARRTVSRRAATPCSRMTWSVFLSRFIAQKRSLVWRREYTQPIVSADVNRAARTCEDITSIHKVNAERNGIYTRINATL